MPLILKVNRLRSKRGKSKVSTINRLLITSEQLGLDKAHGLLFKESDMEKPFWGRKGPVQVGLERLELHQNFPSILTKSVDLLVDILRMITVVGIMSGLHEWTNLRGLYLCYKVSFLGDKIPSASKREATRHTYIDYWYQPAIDSKLSNLQLIIKCSNNPRNVLIIKL